jgi:hypothetical protein
MSRKRWIIAGGAVAAVAATVAVIVLAIPNPPPPPPPPPPVTSQPASPVAVAALDGLLLSPDQINTAMGASGMTAAGTYTKLGDDSANVSDKVCLPVDNSGEAAAYAGSGWSAVRDEALQEPGDTSQRTHYVDQAVVLFSSAHGAAAFFTASTQSWPACSNRPFTFTQAGKPDVVWTVGPVANTNGTLSVTKTAEGGDGWTCQHALTVANNVAIDVTACSFNPNTDSAVNIAHQIAAKVPTK